MMHADPRGLTRCAAWALSAFLGCGVDPTSEADSPPSGSTSDSSLRGGTSADDAPESGNADPTDASDGSSSAGSSSGSPGSGRPLDPSTDSSSGRGDGSSSTDDGSGIAGSSSGEETLASTGADDPPSGPPFEDISAEAGIALAHVGSIYVHLTGQGFADYDRDGRLDLLLTGGLAGNVLYHNEGDGSFTESPAGASLALDDGVYNGSVSWADYDNDGWLDAYIGRAGENVLFHNAGGVAFTDVTTTAGVAGDAETTGAAWGDYDQDGWLDLYVVNNNIDHDVLYHNCGDGTFEDVSELVAIPLAKAAFTASWTDYDDDGDPDLYVVNDHNQDNDLWRNDGEGCLGWCFTNVTLETNTAPPSDSMGLAAGDYDNDGDVDFHVTDGLITHLLQNQLSQGTAEFIEVTDEAGLVAPGIGWGTVFFDYDNDGWLDLYLATQNSVEPKTDRLFRNLGDGTFADVTSGSGTSDPDFTFGVAWADFDEDGRVDLVIGNRGLGYRLLRNTGVAGGDGHWLEIDLVGGGPVNADAIGSRVRVTTTGGMVVQREVTSGSSLGSGDSLRLHFGLGTDLPATVEVRWPDGLAEVFSDPPTDAIWTLGYPAG